MLDRQDYEEAILRSLAPPLYEELPRDPSTAFATIYGDALLTAFAGPPVRGQRRDLALKTQDPEKFRAYQRLQKSHGRAGPYYGLIKTHKWDRNPGCEEERLQCLASMKLRPICPGYRSVDVEMSKLLTRCLQALPRPRLAIDSALEVLELLDRFDYASDSCRLLSLDVASMYPSIPVDRAVPLIRERMLEHGLEVGSVTPFLDAEQLANFLGLSIDHTYAVVNIGGVDRFFRQRGGVAMGKSWACECANQFMGWWEDDLEEQARMVGGEVLFACRYVDDYLVGFRGGEESVEAWVAALNIKDPAITLTHELEEGGRISYLDLTIQRTPNGFKTSVYRKASNTGQVVPFNSFTDPRFLRSAVVSDTIRAVRYCKETKERDKEFDHIARKFTRYGYPPTFVHAAVQSAIKSLRLKARALPAPPSLSDRPPRRVSFPFFGSGFHVLRRKASKIGISVVGKTSNTIGSILCSRHKHHLPKGQEAGVVYGIRCRCDGYYVGETHRELETRVSDHRRCCTSGTGSSAFATHKGCDPDFSMDSVDILGQEDNDRLRLLTESAMIQTLGGRNTILVSPNDKAINRVSGTLLPSTWLPLLRRQT